MRCIGSGVPRDPWEHGHVIITGTEPQMFPRNPNGNGSSYFRQRCHRCASTRRYHKRETTAKDKAWKVHREHAAKMVKNGLAPNAKAAAAIMNASGVTVAWLAQTALEAINKPCAGRCFHAEIVNDKRIIEDHVITQWNDLTLDWHDPDQPLNPDNVGWLCMSCNRQKHQEPWASFMARQHAIRMNMEHGVLLPWQPQLSVDEWYLPSS